MAGFKLTSAIYNMYCEDVRPDVPIRDDGGRGFVQSTSPSVQSKGQVSGILVSRSAPAVAKMLTEMRNLRRSLWEELCPRLSTCDGCNPWELPFPWKCDLELCFGGPSDNQERIFRRASRRFGEGDTFFLDARPLDGGSLDKFKIVLLIRPGITSLRPAQKRALREAWNMLQEWRIALSIGRGKVISLLEFIDDFQAEALHSMGTVSPRDGNGSEGLEALHQLQGKKDEVSRRRAARKIRTRRRRDQETEILDEKERLEETMTRLEQDKKRLEEEIKTTTATFDRNLVDYKAIRTQLKLLNSEEENIAREESVLAAEEEAVLSRVDERIRKRLRIRSPNPVL
jgi:hypothetical protein